VSVPIPVGPPTCAGVATEGAVGAAARHGCGLGRTPARGGSLCAWRRCGELVLGCPTPALRGSWRAMACVIALRFIARAAMRRRSGRAQTVGVGARGLLGVLHLRSALENRWRCHCGGPEAGCHGAPGRDPRRYGDARCRSARSAGGQRAALEIGVIHIP